MEDKVVDSREAKVGDTIRRRRECVRCGRRFTTYERIDEIPHMIVKKDGRREKFDRQKLMVGLMKACERRPIPPKKLDKVAYVRFASVYLDFKDVREFMDELKDLLKARGKRSTKDEL